jgi:hypothetical protein
LGLFTFLFAPLTAHGKQQRPQTPRRNLLFALDAESVGACVEASERRVDLDERVGMHLQQRQRQMVLAVGLRLLEVVCALLRAAGPPVSDPMVNPVEQALPTFEESLLESVGPIVSVLLNGLLHVGHPKARAWLTASRVSVPLCTLSRAQPAHSCQGRVFMKPLAIVGGLLLVLGLVALVYQGITYTTRDTVLDIGPLHATADRQKTLPLSPVLGLAAVGAGVALLIVGVRKRA